MIRTLTAADLDAVVALERAAQDLHHPWSAKQLLEELQHADARVLGVWDDEGLVGYAAFRRIAHEAWLLNLAVHPRARRRGLGRALVEEGALWVASLGITELWLEVRASNAPARALYERLGFRIEGVRPRYYSPAPGGREREDAVLMCRRLPSSAGGASELV